MTRATELRELTLSFTSTPSAFVAIKAAAAQENRTISNFVLNALLAYIRQHHAGLLPKGAAR